MKKTIKGKLTISRNSSDTVCISIEDCESHVEFATVKLTVENFGYAITGLARQDVDIEVMGLDSVGKKRITETREVIYPIKSYDRTQMENWIKENCQEDGWEINSYLGSQKSIQYKDDHTILRYSVIKYE